MKVLTNTLLFLVFSASSALAVGPITKLKDPSLQTQLVSAKQPAAVIVAPSGDAAKLAVALIQNRVKALSGVELSVADAALRPEKLLAQTHVIALGNMSDNAFIRALYTQWYTLLDAKYPGNGGYELRSLHNPLGTGKNVIFVGGSDAAGVEKAAAALAGKLEAKEPLAVGWLMEIRLGEEVKPPPFPTEPDGNAVYSWQDSWRGTWSPRAEERKGTGYEPSTFFGWNPISIAGMLYYMTGRKEYLDTFKALAMPDPKRLPKRLLIDEAFEDPADALVKSYHYRAHLLDLVWDLIEESPLFTDQERLYITNKLIEHQLHYDPRHVYSKANPDRHGAYHMLSIYTGSRYFQKYYPDPVWDKRIENVRTGFRSFIGNPTWGERDTLEWVSTSIEPVFDFFLMDGADDFVKSGTALTFMRGLEALRTGDQVDDFNRYLPINMLFKASYFLNDNRYVWMAHQLGADFDMFRIGQSYWPAPTLAEPPIDLVGKASVVPLARSDRETSKTPVSASEAFQLLSFRSGLQASDDFLQLDGFEGLGRHPYQVNTLSRLRMFAGKSILAGYANDLNIWHNGMTDAHVARSAALKQQVTTKTDAYIHTLVPDMPGSKWQRRVIYRKDSWCMVLDRVTADRSGRFDIVSSWEAGSNVKGFEKPARRVELGNGAGILSADITFEQVSASIVQAKVSRELEADDSVSLATLFFDNARPKAITALNHGGYLISGSRPAFVHVGPYRSKEFFISAEFACIDRDLLLLEGATDMAFQGAAVFRSDRPVTILWDLKTGSAVVWARETVRIQLASSGQSIDKVVQPGERVISSAAPLQGLPGRIENVVTAMKTDLSTLAGEEVQSSKPQLDWQPKWEIALDGKVNKIAGPDTSAEGQQWFWAVSQQGLKSQLSRIGLGGRLLSSTKPEGEILSVWPARSKDQSRAFSLLVGFKDDTLRAFAETGKEIWAVKAEIHPSFMIGDRYEAPWFTDPRPPYNMTGVYSILVGDFWGIGREEIAIGRPCTVEFYDLNGHMNARVPTRWGNNTALALQRDSAMNWKSPVLLAGKAFTGSPHLSGINHAYSNIGDNLFGEIAPGFTNMHAWLQRGLSGLRVADIDNIGGDEVILTLSGHWNELRVYDANGKIRWMQFFGPDKKGIIPFFTALETMDLTGDGSKEVIVGTKKGWLMVFSSAGTLLWQRPFAGGVTCLSVNDEKRLLVVGCDDGSLVLLDADGRQRSIGKMAGAVRAVVFKGSSVFAGSDKGQICHYQVSH